MSRSPDSFGVVGAGILGLAIARRLQETHPQAQVTVVEKETSVARHQTGHNSGVVHAGVYYQPGSLKARLCQRGARLLSEYCSERHLPFERCGKIVVAVCGDEVPALREIERRAQANGVPGVRWLGPLGITEVEPRARGVAALHSPATAITDYVAISESLAADVWASGGSVLVATEVTAVRPGLEGVRFLTRSGGDLRFDQAVICAGLHSARLAGSAGASREPAIVPFRGEYLRLVPERTHLCRGLVYPVPDPRYPFLGVHFTRRVDGSVEVGPNAVLATALEGYRRRDVSVRDLASMASYPGFWRVAQRHWRTGLLEAAGSASTRLFVRRASRYVPELRVEDVVRGGAGVRAQAVDRSGGLVDDFRIDQVGPVTALRNAPSPAATSALAIAEHVVDRVTSDS